MRIIVLPALTLLIGATLSSQRPPAPEALDLSAAEVVRMAKLGVNNPLKSIDAGKHAVFFVMEARKGDSKPGNGITHAEITEIYLIVQGSGTLRSALHDSEFGSRNE